MCAFSQQNETTKSNDPLAKALAIVKRIPLGETRTLTQLITKKGGESALREAIKRLITCGWSEYEFTDDYSAVRRLPLPDYARDYFKKLRNEYTNSKRN